MSQASSASRNVSPNGLFSIHTAEETIVISLLMPVRKQCSGFYANQLKSSMHDAARGNNDSYSAKMLNIILGHYLTVGN